jgi:hypothetical protein
MYGRFYGFALDKQVDRTRDLNKASRHKARNRASESKSVKWVERKGLALKEGRRTPEELVVAHITTKRPIHEEANRYNKQQMQHLLLRRKNRHEHVNACMTWQL